MSAQSLSTPPEGYFWDQCLYTDEWHLVKDIDPIREGIRQNQIHLEKFMQISGWIAVNQGMMNITNLAGLQLWDVIPQTTDFKPRAFRFYHMDPSFEFVRNIQRSPHLLHDMELCVMKNVKGLMTIRTIHEFHNFVRDFQNPTMVFRTSEEMEVPLGLCAIAPCKEVTYETIPDLYKVTTIQWNRVQDAGYFGWMINPSLHDEAMKYSWYQQMGEPMTFIWDIRALPNPSEDLERITFS